MAGRVAHRALRLPDRRRHGIAYDAGALPALVCIDGAGDRAGVVSYQIADGQLEIVSIDATTPRHGAGSALLDAAVGVARSEGCWRAWLITTNDNLDALRFYQRRGWRLVQVHQGAVDAARALKPQIPKTGAYGIDIHDEIELEHALTG